MNQVHVRSERCKECRLCKKNCPRNAITFSKTFQDAGYRYPIIDEERCIACGICYTVCPDGVFVIVSDEQKAI